MVIARTRTPIAVRVYRTLLAALLPPRFREQYAGEMALVFAALYAEATRTGGCRGGLRALGAELPGLLRLAVRERRAQLTLREPDRLLAMGEGTSTGRPTDFVSTSPASFYTWQQQARTVRIAGFSGADGTLTGRAEPERIEGQ